MRKVSSSLFVLGVLGVMALVALGVIIMNPSNPTSKIHGWPQSYVFEALEGAGAGNTAYFRVDTGEPVKKISLFLDFSGRKQIKEEVSDANVLVCRVTSQLPDPQKYHAEVVDYKGNTFKSKPIKVKFSGFSEDFPPKFMETYFITDYSHDFNPDFVWLKGNIEIFFIVSDIGRESGIRSVKLFQYVEDEKGGYWNETKKETINISYTDKEYRTQEFFKFAVESPEKPGEYRFYAEAKDWGGNTSRSKIIKIAWRQSPQFLFQ